MVTSTKQELSQEQLIQQDLNKGKNSLIVQSIKQSGQAKNKLGFGLMLGVNDFYEIGIEAENTYTEDANRSYIKSNYRLLDGEKLKNYLKINNGSVNLLDII